MPSVEAPPCTGCPFKRFFHRTGHKATSAPFSRGSDVMWCHCPPPRCWGCELHPSRALLIWKELWQATMGRNALLGWMEALALSLLNQWEPPLWELLLAQLAEGMCLLGGRNPQFHSRCSSQNPCCRGYDGAVLWKPTLEEAPMNAMGLTFEETCSGSHC